MGKKRDKKLKQNGEKLKEKLTLDDVLNLGGSKADFELLQGVEDEESETVDITDDIDVEPIKRDEVHQFIKDLGFDKIMEVTEEVIESDKKKKLLKAPMSSEEKQQKAKEPSTEKKKNKNKFKVQDNEISSSTDTVEFHPGTSSSFVENYQTRKSLLIKPGGKWFDHLPGGKPWDSQPSSKDAVVKIRKYTEKLMADEVTLYKKQQEQNKSSNARWIRTVLASGTIVDKTAALTLLVQDSPIHTLQSLDALIGMVKKKARREALTALGTVKELWLSDLLLEDRKFHKFEDNPLEQVDELASGNRDSRDRKLLVWYYEDQLKERYETFVKALEAMSHDQISGPKKKVMSAVFDLLAGKPEQEKVLLDILINKLGDPDGKVASKSAVLLTKLVEKHPNMKMVVCKEVEKMLHRKNIAEKAQYYGICFLNQLLLSHSEKTLAAKLINIYFSFFKVFIKKKNVENKMLSALLTGVNRAFPYAKVDLKSLENELNSIYKTVHVVQFNTALQALMLLFQVVDSSDTVMCDRYYQALYKKLLDPGLKTSSRHAMFLNLLFKSLKKDDSEKRIKAFLKRLLQLCCHMTPTFICGALVLLSEILKVKPTLMDVAKVNKQIELELEEDDDEEERFIDVKGESDLEGSEGDHSDLEASSDEGHVEEVKKALSDKGHTTVASWVHRSNMGKHSESGSYDPLHRNPMYCHADRECVWELRRLAKHFHPSVGYFTMTLLKGEKIHYAGDPLQDFSLIRFLDRFVYRNPKKKANNVVSSLDPRSKAGKVKGIKALAINDEKYAQMDEDSVPVEEKFFYKYFKQQAAKSQKKRVEDYDSDAESVDDAEFDDFLDQYEYQLEGGGQDIDFDFAGEFDKKKSGKKKKQDDVDSDSDDMDDDLSDEEMDLGELDMDMGDLEDDDSGGEWEDGGSDEDTDQPSDDEMEMGDTAGFDEEDVAFSDEDDLEEFDFSKDSKKKSKGKQSTATGGKGKSKKSNRSELSAGGLFAAAEEFAHLIDENAGSKFDLIGTEALSNKDNAHLKQIKWESDRDKWVRGQDWRSKRKRNKSQGRGKPAQKQRKKFKAH